MLRSGRVIVYRPQASGFYIPKAAPGNQEKSKKSLRATRGTRQTIKHPDLRAISVFMTSTTEKKPKNPRVKRWCGTVHTEHNDHIWNLDELTKWCEEHCSYAIGQRERGDETGRDHWQLYVEFKTPRSYARGKIAGLGGSWRAAAGTADQNKTYCSKSETSLGQQFELGTPAIQGDRSDLKELREAVIADGIIGTLRRGNHDGALARYEHLCAPRARGAAPPEPPSSFSRKNLGQRGLSARADNTSQVPKIRWDAGEAAHQRTHAETQA